jgi:hypothetical protein
MVGKKTCPPYLTTAKYRAGKAVEFVVGLFDDEN